MNIHEYQGKEIFRKYGVPVPQGKIANTPTEVVHLAKELGFPCVVKAQIHAGGRGKGVLYSPQDIGKPNAVVVCQGGVKLVQSVEEAETAAQKILGHVLVTHQTGPAGKQVKRVLVEQGLKIAKEYYLGLVLDRASSRITIMASKEGGVEIEKVASESPEKILKESIDPVTGFMPFQGRKLAFGLGLPKNVANKFVQFVAALYRCYLEADCSLVEINPLVLTEQGELLAADAKLNFDDNAIFRHADYEDLHDFNEEKPAETEANNYDLSYISLDGNIGCMVNGAGLAMATMDIIKLHGGMPANFLDVGGGATAEKVTKAFKIILSDSKVEAILVNIFGGIMKCDVIASGIVQAVKEVGLKLPLIVRLQGTNVDIGNKILKDSGLTIISADTMEDAAEKAVQSIK